MAKKLNARASGKIVSVVKEQKINDKGTKGTVAVTWVLYLKKGKNSPTNAIIGEAYPCYDKITFKPVLDVMSGTKTGSCVSFDFNLLGNPPFLVATNVDSVSDTYCS